MLALSFGRRMASVIALVLSFVIGVPAVAGEFGSRDEAQAMVNKAVGLIAAKGKDAFPAFEDANGGFKDRDLYVFVYDMQGVNVSHGANKALIGKNLRTMKDVDGKMLIDEMIGVVSAKGEGWVDYKWQNPVTKKIEDKSSFVKKAAGELFVGVGVYRTP